MPWSYQPGPYHLKLRGFTSGDAARRYAERQREKEMKSKNRFRESVSYRRTGDPNIIERVHVSYIDVGRLKRRIAEIDKELKALPRPKEPPSREEFEKDYRIPGCSYDEFVELTMMRNEYLQSAAERQALEEEKQRLEAKIDKLKQMATERE